MGTDFAWRRDEDFTREVGSASDERVRAILSWAIAGESATAQNGRHNSPKARRGWRSRRLEAEAELARRGLI